MKERAGTETYETEELECGINSTMELEMGSKKAGTSTRILKIGTENASKKLNSR